MTVQEMIYQASGCDNAHDDLIQETSERCILCGKELKEGIDQKKIIGTNFSQRDELRKGNFICEACANVMKGDLAVQLRRSSFLVSDGILFYFKIQEASEMILKRHSTPFVLCITTSYKKHNAFRAVMNYSDEEFIIRWENRTVDFNREEATALYRDVIKLYYGGFTKDEVRIGHFPSHRVRDFGILAFEKIHDRIKDYFDTDLMDLLTTIAPSIKRQTYTKLMKEAKKKNVKPSGKTSGQTSLFSVEKH